MFIPASIAFDFYPVLLVIFATISFACIRYLIRGNDKHPNFVNNMSLSTDVLVVGGGFAGRRASAGLMKLGIKVK